MDRIVDDLTCDIVLPDGSTLSVRPAANDDVAALEAFFKGLSPESRYQRFLGPVTPNRAAIAGMIPDRNIDGVCLIALSLGTIAGAAAYYTERDRPDHAEAAVAVSDAMQRRGVGTGLLDRLAAAAHAQGIRTFDADVQDSNSALREMLVSAGYSFVETVADSVHRVSMNLAAIAPRARL